MGVRRPWHKDYDRTKSKVSIDKLATEIAEALKVFSQEVVEQVDISSEQIGKEAVKQLKKTSPKRYGDYRKSWTMTSSKDLAQPNRRIIHVKAPQYRLTHLLEHGHAKAGGGRVAAKPHIAPVEEEVIKTFVKAVEEAIERG